MSTEPEPKTKRNRNKGGSEDYSKQAILEDAKREKIPAKVIREIQIESGFRCGNPRCTWMNVLHSHHIIYVSQGGKNESWNLLPLCPNCHASHHAGEIPSEAIRTWKSVLISLNDGIDRKAKDLLIYLDKVNGQELWYTGDGALQFSSLIALGLVSIDVEKINHYPQPVAGRYGMHHGPVTEIGLRVKIELSERGKLWLNAWYEGDESKLREANLPPS